MAHIDASSKDALALVATNARDSGHTINETLALLQGPDRRVAKRTMQNWIKCYEETGHALPTESAKRGRHSAFSDEQTKLMLGWAIWRNNNNRKVCFREGAEFAAKSLHVEVSPRTVRNLLHEHGFKKRDTSTVQVPIIEPEKES